MDLGPLRATAIKLSGDVLGKTVTVVRECEASVVTQAVFLATEPDDLPVSEEYGRRRPVQRAMLRKADVPTIERGSTIEEVDLTLPFEKRVWLVVRTETNEPEYHVLRLLEKDNLA